MGFRHQIEAPVVDGDDGGEVRSEVEDIKRFFLKVAKVNVDEAHRAANELGIRAIPTVILFKDGKPVQQFVGVTQEANDANL